MVHKQVRLWLSKKKKNIRSLEPRTSLRVASNYLYGSPRDHGKKVAEGYGSLPLWHQWRYPLSLLGSEWSNHQLISLIFQQQKTIQQQEAAPYLGEFFTDDVPTIRRVIIRYNEGKMTFAVDKHVFRLNHIKGTTFELIDRRKVDCLIIALMGINHERVHFDPPGSSPDGVSTGFTVFGFHLRGKAYFRRKQLWIGCTLILVDAVRSWTSSNTFFFYNPCFQLWSCLWQAHL